jgi:acyl-CoA reductase-like NAD-dependent aldehyde dehydrogenase
MKIINPATEEIIGEITDTNRLSLRKKFGVLKKTQPLWAAKTVGERLVILQNFYDLLEIHREHLAGVLTREVGKPLQQSRNEINGARMRIQWMLNNAERILAEEWMTTDQTTNEKISYEPLGVVCNISAWNYPYLVGVNVFVPALIAGNAVMYKPSEFATMTGLEIEKLLKKSGVPDGILQVACGGKDTGELLLDLDFNGYFFTGSFKTGKYIYQRIAKKMVPCQLELGGKDPLYVTDDIASIEKVAVATADGAFYNNGQSCCAVERIYVHEAVFNEYLDAFVKEVMSWKIGPPTEEGVYLGPITRSDQLSVLEKQVKDALDKGADLLCGGKRAEGKGYYFQPTVLINVTHKMRLMNEESFGPVIGIMKVKNDEEALKFMQDTEYGLTASVYADHPERAEAILSQIDAGTGYWNCCDRVSAAVPWSGRKHSGIGTTLSYQGIRVFTKPKSWHLRNSV